MKMVFPYATLCPDNQRHGVIVVKNRARIILTKKYRDAKEKISLLAMGQYQGEPMTGELAMEATLFTPTARKTDPSNFAKLLHDALQGIVYADDCQIARSTYIRGAIDRENPRVELVLEECDLRTIGAAIYGDLTVLENGK